MVISETEEILIIENSQAIITPPIIKSKPGRKPKGKEKANKDGVPEHVQLIDHLPRANENALETFTQIHQNWYQNKSLGNTKQLEEVMVCDCVWKPGDDPELACSLNSGCINYLTQVECLQDQCKCREKCQNQRFQRRLYAPIEIVLTPQKGFGMRINSDLPMDTFVYEYLGEVIGSKLLHKRLKEYAAEGIQHFYFMELQKDQYIDATKKGGFGRFLNHSCNPNCYIGKWVVGKQLRMGIFTKRDVKSGEELTFNYNVDRYGHSAQECFCGEMNCVGILGGKTQTDIGQYGSFIHQWSVLFDPLPPLGLEEDVENLDLKGSKTKKSKSMDIDYMPIMKPILLKEVPTVASAIRQSTSNKKILSKLLRRIMITSDESVQKQLMRLHGFSLMSMVLNEYLEDQEIVKTTLEILLKWPLITKNKIVSTNIEETVMKLNQNPNEVIQTLAAELIKMWVALEVTYRIPKDEKSKKNGELADGSKRKAEALLDQIFSKRIRDSDARKDLNGLKLVSEKTFIRPEAAKPLDPQTIKPENLILPPDWAFERTAEGIPYYYHVAIRQTQWTVPTPADVALMNRRLAEELARQKALAVDVEDIVAKAKAEAEEIRKANEAQRLLDENERIRLESLQSDHHHHHHRKDKHRSHRPSSSSNHHHHRKKSGKDPLVGGHSNGRSNLDKGTGDLDPDELISSKDRKMKKLFGNVIVSAMSRYYKDSLLDREQFKRRAKELTDILCEKERKSSQYETEKYEDISAGKETKIKAFTKDWVGKLLTRRGITIPAPTSSNSVAVASGSSGNKTSGNHPSDLNTTSTSNMKKDDSNGTIHQSRIHPPAHPNGSSSSSGNESSNEISLSHNNRRHSDPRLQINRNSHSLTHIHHHENTNRSRSRSRTQSRSNSHTPPPPINHHHHHHRNSNGDSVDQSFNPTHHHHHPHQRSRTNSIDDQIGAC
ncbi:hypothetical protein PSHT_13372 [Puccinia striiformis]|uniref:Histone-lysine N-methyltransferase, H3 lysine-36 specific n=1 Tax=Puccinia striiformis TaxID=27350 RepID=A0A2S4UR56_9BASI|nr:hypothetical protein PSHT_13372 [Puccinia striiformis]